METLDIAYLGCVDYAEALQIQREIHSEILNAQRNSTLLLLEHFPVITLGKNASLAHLLHSEEELKKQNIAVHRIERGGEATAHEPGQLVVYPLIDLRKSSYGPRNFVHKLEDCIIDTLKHYGIDSRRDDRFPGVWTGSGKICSLGVRISQGVSMHGLALNSHNDLNTFSKIIPCGIENCQMLKVTDFREKVELKELGRVFSEIFCKNFQVRSYRFLDFGLGLK